MTPTPRIPQIDIASYADDISITSQHRKADTPIQQLQPYLDTLDQWFSNNKTQKGPNKIHCHTPLKLHEGT